MVKFVVKFRWICLKRKIKTNQNSPVLRRKLRRILTLHTVLTQKLRRKLRRQNFASKKVPTKSRQLFAVDKLISCPCGHLHKQTCMFIGMNLATIEQK